MNKKYVSRGFTLIELMIVVGIIAIILTLALPVYSNYAIRAKVGEGLSVAASAKTAVSSTCVESPTIPALTSALAGYAFVTTDHVQSIEVSGPCSAPVITIETRQTGASTDPTLILTGDFTPGSSRVSWICSSTSSNIYLPRTCRS